MKISLVRTDKQHQLCVSTRTTERLLERMIRDDARLTITRFRDLSSRMVATCNAERDLPNWHRVYPAAEFQKDDNGNLLMRVCNGLLLLSFRHIEKPELLPIVKREAAFRRGEKTYLDAEQTALIMENNKQFQMQLPMELCFLECFAPAESEKEGKYMTVAALYEELKAKYGSSLEAKSLLSFGRVLKNMDGLQRKKTMKGTEYLVVRLN